MYCSASMNFSGLPERASNEDGTRAYYRRGTGHERRRFRGFGVGLGGAGPATLRDLDGERALVALLRRTVDFFEDQLADSHSFFEANVQLIAVPDLQANPRPGVLGKGTGSLSRAIFRAAVSESAFAGVGLYIRIRPQGSIAGAGNGQ
jgi:hypothetical protein